MKHLLKANYVLKYAAEDDFPTDLCKGKIEPKNTYEIRHVSITFDILYPLSSSFFHISVLKSYIFFYF